jgi:glycosyltransferase involved in cell wall biosynthesis
MDTVIWPRLLALDADFTWIMEYDVDFSGDWATLFEQFRANPADLLTTTILPRGASAGWFWWRSAAAPPHVRREHMHRAFLPMMRVSNRFARSYAQDMADPRWSGHYEFIIPTAAISAGLLVEDIGGDGPFCPSERRNRNYRNSPKDWRLSPGTFVWRPSQDRYFVEAPNAFSEADMLYHPVKADIPEWRRDFASARATRPIPNAAAAVSVAMATYNGERHLRAQLESLAQQEMAPDELVVCDDASTDSTVAILREFAAHASFRVEVIESRVNRGYARTFFAAAQKCRGGLIFFCDQDDVWSPGKISTISRIAASSSGQAFSHDISVFSEVATGPSLPSYFAYLRRTGFSPAVCIKGCATAVRSEFIRDWGWPDAGSDVAHDLWVALLATAFRQRQYIDQPLVEHRLHAGNASGWIASDADRVRSARWSAARRQRQSDQELLIELCIKRWNLDWTDEFLRVLAEHRGELAEDLSSDLLAGLRANRRYHTSSLHRLMNRLSF